MEECIFCKIVKGEVPADVIYEDEQVFSFLDIRPTNKGHALVIPKRHSDNMLAADDADLASLVLHTKKIAAGILKATGAGGFNLHVNTRPVAGQVVMHTHFHIIPRYDGDGLKLWPHMEIEPQTRAEMAQEIRKFL